jgi:hypothetical protein
VVTKDLDLDALPEKTSIPVRRLIGRHGSERLYDETGTRPTPTASSPAQAA